MSLHMYAFVLSGGHFRDRGVGAEKELPFLPSTPLQHMWFLQLSEQDLYLQYKYFPEVIAELMHEYSSGVLN